MGECEGDIAFPKGSRIFLKRGYVLNLAIYNYRANNILTNFYIFILVMQIILQNMTKCTLFQKVVYVSMC